MRRTRIVAAAMAVTLLAGGCAVTRENQNACKVGWAMIGATVGGAGAGEGVSKGVSDPNDGEIAGAAAGGTVAGALLGLLAGHYICQVEEPPPSPPSPPPPPPPISGKIESLTGPSFNFDRSELTAVGRAHVDHAAQVLQQNPSVHVVVEGHTDSVGTHAYNMKLSQRRADTVRSYLEQKGISASRITTAAYGETQPVASNATAEGRAQNRRVDIVAR